MRQVLLLLPCTGGNPEGLRVQWLNSALALLCQAWTPTWMTGLFATVRTSVQGCQGQRDLKQGCSPPLCGLVSHFVMPRLTWAACQDTLCPTSSPSLWPSLFTPGPHSLQTSTKPRMYFWEVGEHWLNLLHFTHTLVDIFFKLDIFFLLFIRNYPGPTYSLL